MVQMGLVVLGVLVVASVAVALLKRRRPEKDFSELSARVRAWWIMAAVFFGAVVVSNRISLVFFALLSFWAMKEYVTLLKTRPADHHALVLTFLAVPIQYLWIALDPPWYGMFIIFIPVYMLLSLPVRMVLSKETRGFVESASQIQWGLMIFVFGLSHMAYLLTLPTIGDKAANGRTLVLFLVFVVEMSDVLVAGFFGGAVMSAVKRDFGVKDFGGIIPGHGGMLDRVDSLCYAAPVFFHYVRYFYTN